MLLAIDIGNTNISLGVFIDRRLIKRYTISTKNKQYRPALKKIFLRDNIEAAVISSVVPEVTTRLAGSLKGYLKDEVYVIGEDIFVPIRNLYRNPRQVGQDRLVDAYAATLFYGAPLIVVDFGTAITFDVIAKNKAYLGGMILPGLEISLDALNKRTALLPKIKLGPPREFIGRDTKNSIRSGVIYGFAALTDALVAKIKAKLGKKKILVIGTGGNIDLIANFIRSIDKIDRDLTLKGINLIYGNR